MSYAGLPVAFLEPNCMGLSRENKRVGTKVRYFLVQSVSEVWRFHQISRLAASGL